jgi:hypothetical protein
MEKKVISWNGWNYVSGKKSYWKYRHNPEMKNFVEKVKISQDEYTNIAKIWASIFTNT